MQHIQRQLWFAALICAASAWLSHPALGQSARYVEFTTKFKAALGINAADEMAKLVKQFQEEAIGHIDVLCDEMARQNSEELDREFQALSRAWQEAMKTNFAENVYVYHSELALDPPRKVERQRIKDAFYATMARRDANKADKGDAQTYAACGADFASQAAAFEQVGDLRFAGWAEGAAAECFDSTLRPKDPDLRKACEHMGRAVKHYEKIELVYPYTLALKARYESLVQQGYEAPAPEPGAPQPGAGPAPAATPAVMVSTSFERIGGIDDFIRPSYFNDDIYQIWPLVALGAKGSFALDKDVSIALFKSAEKGPQILRTDAAKIGVDCDRDGKPEKTVGLTGNLTPVEVEIGEGASKRTWAFAFKTGVQDDTFQGLKTNLSPDDRQVQLYCVNVGSVLATINAVPVRVLDDNLDGVYGSAPKTYGYPGLSKDTYQPDMDSIVVGATKRARPWSQYQEIGGAWFDLASENGGLQLKVTPVQLTTGTLRLEFKGPAPNWLVVQGEGPLEHCYFDLITETKKPVVVPAGTYHLSCGEIRQGKKQQVVKSLIMPGPRTPPYVVRAGAETVVTLGAPFGFEFDTRVEEEKLTVIGSSVTITGVAGERYERVWNAAPRPEISVRKAGTKKGSKPEKMDVVLDLQDVQEDGSYRYLSTDTWRPIDTSVEIRKGEQVQAQLVEKKNKLFGEIESEWK